MRTKGHLNRHDDDEEEWDEDQILEKDLETMLHITLLLLQMVGSY